jgi:hypothetical protein
LASIFPYLLIVRIHYFTESCKEKGKEEGSGALLFVLSRQGAKNAKDCPVQSPEYLVS